MTVMTLALVFMSAWISSQDPARTGPGVKRFTPQSAGGAINILVPEPLSDAEADRYEWMLRLNSMQSELYRAMLSKHRETAMVAYDSTVRELWSDSAQIAMEGGFASDPVVTERFADLMRRRNDAAEQLGRFDDALFDGLLPSLTEEQAPLVESVKRHRHRRRLDVVRQEYPGAAFDLSVVVVELARKGETVIGDGVAFNTLLGDYDTALTTAQSLYAAERVKVMVDEARDAASMSGATQAEINEISARIRAMQARLTKRAERVAEINRQYVKLLVPLMKPQAGEIVRDQFNHNSFPTVYPNPFDITRLADLLRKDSKIKSEQREAADPVIQLALTDQATTSEKIADEYARWRGEWLLTRAKPGESFEQHKATMDVLQGQRRKIAVDLLAYIEAELPKLGSDVKAARSALSKQLKDHQPRASGSQYFP